MHAHLWPGVGLTPGQGADVLLLDMERHQVERTVLSNADAIFYDYERANRELGDAIRGKSGLFGLAFGNPNYVEESMASIARCLDEAQFVGIKLYSRAYMGEQSPINCDGHKRIIEFVTQEYPWALVMFHCGENDPANYENMLELAKMFPDANFIGGHTGARRWRSFLAALAGQENVYAELATPWPWRPMIEEAVEVMGEGRVVWGSDYPLIGVPFMEGALLSADLPRAVKEKVFYANALRLVQWER